MVQGWLVTQDLMLASQTRPLAERHGVALQCVAAVADLREPLQASTSPIRVVIVDLAAGVSALTQITSWFTECEPLPRRIAVGPHVDRQTLEAARDAGWEAWTRGQWHAGAAELFGSLSTLTR